jgi:hypothetical protein
MTDTTTETSTTNGDGSQHEATEPPEGGQQQASASEDVDSLKAALANERKRWEKAERELADLRKAQMSDNEKAVTEAKEAGRSEAAAEYNARLLAAEVRAHASDKLADPGDAVRLLDLADLAAEDGSPDVKRITSAIDKLVEAKPYLAKRAVPPAGGGSRPPQGARDGSEGNSADDFIRRAARNLR